MCHQLLFLLPVERTFFRGPEVQVLYIPAKLLQNLTGSSHYYNLPHPIPSPGIFARHRHISNPPAITMYIYVRNDNSFLNVVLGKKIFLGAERQMAFFFPF